MPKDIDLFKKPQYYMKLYSFKKPIERTNGGYMANKLARNHKFVQGMVNGVCVLVYENELGKLFADLNGNPLWLEVTNISNSKALVCWKSEKRIVTRYKLFGEEQVTFTKIYHTTNIYQDKLILVEMNIILTEEKSVEVCWELQDGKWMKTKGNFDATFSELAKLLPSSK